MKKKRNAVWMILWIVLVITSVSLLSCGSSSESNGDCQQAFSIWGDPKTSYYGQSCSAGSYGTCTTLYDNCIEGVCKYSDSANGDICAKTCTTTAECGTGLYCKNAFCQPGASCSTYCDGYLCCNYYQDPSDPTICKQGACY